MIHEHAQVRMWATGSAWRTRIGCVRSRLARNGRNVAVCRSGEDGILWEGERMDDGTAGGPPNNNDPDGSGWHSGAPEDLESLHAALVDAAAARERVPDESPEMVRDSVRRIAELISVLPHYERDLHFEEARRKVASHRSSLRKLEKKLRQAAILDVAEARIDAVVGLAPEIRIDDMRGSLRFSVAGEERLQVAGRPHTSPVYARVIGGPLERALLTQEPATFVATAREMLGREMEAARTAARSAAERINRILEERVDRPLYNVRTLRRVVQSGLRDGYDLEDALERIEFDIAPLDREASERERVRALVEERGLIAYRDYFPRARSMQRELILYAGPTNSGKTWRALNDLVEGENGAYLAPLRLLALEGQEEIEKRGRAASFVTGEERDIREGASFVASTIEMMDSSRDYDVVVIDEVQLLTDEDRGWAWCQALVGAPARRVIMTGSPDCVPIVEAMAEYLGEPLTIHRVERHTPIEAEPQPLSLSKIEPGTALIAFSRRNVLALKAELETRFRVAVIYGNLTPEVRREEARRFRSGEAQIVVSTDAIAMGLNLPIRTVCFSTLVKWNGREEVELSPAEMLQIGGRAGRFGHFEKGHVAALNRRDALRLQEIFAPGYAAPTRPLATSVRPGSDHIAVIAEGLRTPRLARALAAFQRGMTFDSELLSPGVHDDMIALAEIADRHRSIPLADRLTLSCAPVDMRTNFIRDEFAGWIAQLAEGDEVTLGPIRAAFSKERAANDQELQSAEMEAKRLTLYAWLAYRYPESFPDLAECDAQRRELDEFIEKSLAMRAGRNRRERREGPPGRGGGGRGRGGHPARAGGRRGRR
jgi:ATP-dependent RNA helicase SUPV3L1/SUV3